MRKLIGLYFALAMSAPAQIWLSGNARRLNGVGICGTAPTNAQALVYNGSAWCPAAAAGTGTVTSVAQTFTGGIVAVGGSPVTTAGSLALTVAGTSGGIPYFSSTSAWASSALLTSKAFVLGGGAGAAPTALDPAFTTQTDGATITWAIGSVPLANATVTLGGNRTLDITNPMNGGSYVLKIVQDGTGSRTLALGTGCTWKIANGGAGAITLTAAAASIDILTFVYDGTNCYGNLQSNFN